MLKLFIELTDEINKKCVLSTKNAKTIGLPDGGIVLLMDINKTVLIKCLMTPDPEALDFSVKIAKDIFSKLNYDALEIKIDKFKDSNAESKSKTPSVPPKPTLPPSKPSKPTVPPSIPSKPTVPPSIPSKPTLPPSIPSKPTLPPSISSKNTAPSPTSSSIPSPEPPVIKDPYPNKIDIQKLASQNLNSIIIAPKITLKSRSGKVTLNQKIANSLNLYPNALVGWEDPLTREIGSARLQIGSIDDRHILLDEDTAFDTNIEAVQIVLYSLEPPIEKSESITLEVDGKSNNGGFIDINYRNAMSLEIKEEDIISFEDELTGAFGAGKLRINENVPNEKVVIDQELIEASGIGSYEVELKKNIRKIIPLQSLELGVAPIAGDNIWEIISMTRENINIIKDWLNNYIIYKGIKLRWKKANVAIEILDTVPNLTGDVLAKITPSTTIELKPTGLVTFNAILIIDISRSMMARDVLVTNIGPALEGIKAAMHDKEIKEFLAKFKPGINVPRRLSAAFSAILFLSEKVGRGFGEKVSIIRFADEAQILQMSEGKKWMDSSSGQKGELEECARKIVSQIGNSYGQATNMGLAMEKAMELLDDFEIETPNQPSMIVLLTDGSPTDGNAFMKTIEKISENENVVLYIIGLGNPDDTMMKKAVSKCAGEYFKPEDSGELLVWYSKRARDLTLKMRREEK